MLVTLRGQDAAPPVLFFQKLEASSRVIRAVLPIDMQTRFGRSYLSYLITIIWPFTHLVFIALGYIVSTTIAPIGDDPAVFVGTAALPYILCFYPARMMASTIDQNKYLLNFTIVQPVHLIIARGVCEIINAIIVTILFLFSLRLVGVNFMPENIPDAALALAASIYLGIGFGAFNITMIVLFGPFAIVVYFTFMIFFFLSSGAYVPLWAMPAMFKAIAPYNPLYCLIEWMRSAYFVSYESDIENKIYVLAMATITLLIGLLGERFFRNKFLA